MLVLILPSVCCYPLSQCCTADFRQCAAKYYKRRVSWAPDNADLSQAPVTLQFTNHKVISSDHATYLWQRLAHIIGLLCVKARLDSAVATYNHRWIREAI